jgi:hypothetical protein
MPFKNASVFMPSFVCSFGHGTAVFANGVGGMPKTAERC